MDIGFVYGYLYMVSLYFIKSICCSLLLCPNIKKLRDGWPFIVIISGCLSAALSLVFYVLHYYISNYWTLTLFNIVLFFCIVVSYYLIFDYSFKESAIVMVASYCIQHISYQLVYLIFDSWIYGVVDASIGYNYLIIYIVDFIAQIAVNLILTLVLQGFFKRNYESTVSSPKVFGFSIVSVLVVSILFTGAISTDGYWQSSAIRVIVSAFCLLACVCILVLMMGAFSLSKYQEKLIETNVFNESVIKQYKRSQEAAEYINVKCHDLRKMIRDYKENNKILDSEDIENIATAIKIYEVTFDTGNDTLDQVLNSKSLDLQRFDINLSTMCDVSELSILKESDLISLFTNILDNAIEATKQIEDINKRSISLVIKNKVGFLYIEETNWYKGGPLKLNDDGLETTSDDKVNHGYGTKSIALIVKKYNGKVEFETDNNIFSVKILIPIK